jgi:cell division protein FtsL
MPKQNHIDQYYGRKQNTSVFRYSLSLTQNEKHEKIQENANHKGMQQHH